MDRHDFSSYFHLNSPVSAGEIAGAEIALGFSLPESYIALLKVTDGLSCNGNLVLLEASDLASRTSDYEVSEYLPGYLMIGDDSGGVALVMQLAGQAIYEVDMGVMDASDLRKSADSLEQLLLELAGKTLGERR